MEPKINFHTVSNKMTISKLPIANPEVVLREEFDDWAILFDPETGEGFGLNPVSVFIYKRLDGQHTTEDISAELRTECEDAPGDVEEHIKEFLQQLEEKGLVGYETK
jgi:SynChlorMet cassette protein ScmD